MHRDCYAISPRDEARRAESRGLKLRNNPVTAPLLYMCVKIQQLTTDWLKYFSWNLVTRAKTNRQRTANDIRIIFLNLLPHKFHKGFEPIIFCCLQHFQKLLEAHHFEDNTERMRIVFPLAT